MEKDELSFFIEVEETHGAVSPEMAPEKFVRATKTAIVEVAQVIEESTATLIGRIGTMSVKPAELSIEFGVDARGEAGVPFVTKGAVGAHFKVAVKWSFKP